MRRWRELELAGNERCTAALQHVPFIATVGGETLCPAEMLDPNVGELRGLYSTEGTAGPFPSAEAALL